MSLARLFVLVGLGGFALSLLVWGALIAVLGLDGAMFWRLVFR